MGENFSLRLNGKDVAVTAVASDRLSSVLRHELGLPGTKVGCDAGDCGACSVLLDGEAVCACMVPIAQAAGRNVITIEGLPQNTKHGAALQDSFLAQGAAQCGICTPGMLVSATALLDSNPRPGEEAIADALGGVLCRCTGYRKIIDAVKMVGDQQAKVPIPAAGHAVGASLPRLDGEPKVRGTESCHAGANRTICGPWPLQVDAWHQVHVALKPTQRDGDSDVRVWLDGRPCPAYRGILGFLDFGKRDAEGKPFVDTQPRFGIYRDVLPGAVQAIDFADLRFWDADPSTDPRWASVLTSQ